MTTLDVRQTQASQKRTCATQVSRKTKPAPRSSLSWTEVNRTIDELTLVLARDGCSVCVVRLFVNDSAYTQESVRVGV